MKAIETRYKGHRFRSRLEARWAVFFDALKIKWTYEPEGFELRDGGRYLPDFFLPTHDLWVEIKAGPATIAEVYKAEQLVYGSRKPVFISAGLPDVHGRLVWPEFGAHEEFAAEFEVLSDATVSVVWFENEARFLARREGEKPGKIFRDWRFEHKHLTLGCTSLTKRALGDDNVSALEAARGARFEFGEAA
jgi:hypothetical protein